MGEITYYLNLECMEYGMLIQRRGEESCTVMFFFLNDSQFIYLLNNNMNLLCTKHP